jgi:hypothetical protein
MTPRPSREENMRLTLTIALLALTAAVPAAAQNTTGPDANTAMTSANAVSTNGVAPGGTPVTGTPTDAAAAPGAQTATLPPDSNAAAVDTAVVRRDGAGRDFPWGLIGLVGLIGLLGRRRSAT